MNDVNGAISDFSQYIQLNPQSPKGYYYRGMIYGKLGDKVNAQKDIDQLRRRGYKVTVKSSKRSQSEIIDENR